MTSATAFRRLSAQEAQAWLAEHPDALLLDARQAAHHDQGHLAGSVRLDGRNHERMLMVEPKSRPVFIYCYHGNASQTYAEMFADFGFHSVQDLIGGWEAWSQQVARSVAEPLGDRVSTEPDAELLAWLDAQGFVDAHTAGGHGNTPLMQAAWQGRGDLVASLLQLGVSRTAVNNDGNNALWLACVSNQPALVQMLADAGVPLDHQNLTGATSLMYAASSSKPEIVQALLALGADPHNQTQDDFTALDMAASLPCLQLLRAATRRRAA
ncbi:ankyrin repeat domain-containing protein [Aquabacterium sp.]|uniref:ankyrin repeat domain-containing protein n=1 Tax=Aquabacterium sp. TaxID=1872578 RepID=UPI0035B07269